MISTFKRRGWRKGGLAVGAAAAMLAGLAGCQADYAADIVNRSSQPVFVQLVTRAHGVGEKSVLAANKRLGPGDRSFIGPVRASDRAGSVFLTIDSLPNTVQPFSMDLSPGTTFLEAMQDDSGAVRVQLKQ
jgi:hypothetical protein